MPCAIKNYPYSLLAFLHHAFTALVFSNIILSLVNRSFYYSVLTSLANRNGMMAFANALTLFLLALILYVAPIANFFAVVPLQPKELVICLAVSAVSVLWIEIWKWNRRRE